MAIVKMKAVTLSAPIDEFDNVVEKYVYGRDIHLENAMSVIKSRKRIERFDENSDYDMIAKNVISLFSLGGQQPDKNIIGGNNSSDEAMQKFIDEVNLKIHNEKFELDKINSQIQKNNDIIRQLDLMLECNVDLQKIFNMEFIAVKFGYIPKTSYKTFKMYLDDLETFFIVTSENATDVWGFYFVPVVKQEKVEEVFDSLYFKAESIIADSPGTPKEIKETLLAQNKELQEKSVALSQRTSQILSESKNELSAIYNIASKKAKFAEIKKNSVHSDMFFYIVGWMPEKDAKKLEAEITASGESILFNIDDPSKIKDLQPPTKLKNNRIFKPFEMFVKMYGLPSYGEIDPTPILAITYILFFAIMFGDVGQSAVLAIVGFLAYKFKKMDLGGIIGTVGLAGIISGFVYGSFFGNEEIIPKLFGITTVKPMESIMPLLIGTVCMGGFIIIFGLCLNIINNLRNHHLGEALFGHNGVAGIIFYLSIVLVAVNALAKLNIPSFVFAILFIVSLLSMYLCTPLSKLVEGEKDWLPKGGMFFVESFFELFEVVLSFCTNTISFLRIGAFAVIHVGMMMAVAALSGDGGVKTIIVTILGNIIVMILEGLIVAIQVLRLEYYEMFSRYFTGNGKEFISIHQ